jgi:hypothetical protein
MTTLTHTATVFPHYEQTAETRRRTSWTAWCTFRIITDTIRVLLREPRSKYYSASTQASSPRHHTTLREIFFRTPIGLGAPESITVKSTARDAPRRSAGQSLRRSRSAANSPASFMWRLSYACVDSVFIRCVDFSPERRRIFGSLRHIARKPRYFKPRAIRLLRKHDTVAIRRGAF